MPLRFLGKIDALYPDLGTTMKRAVDDPFAATSRRQAGNGAVAAGGYPHRSAELVRGDANNCYHTPTESRRQCRKGNSGVGSMGLEHTDGIKQASVARELIGGGT